MPATESGPPDAAAPVVPADDDAKSAEKLEKLTKVEKPDDAKFQKDIAEADKQLSAIQTKMVSSPIGNFEMLIVG